MKNIDIKSSLNQEHRELEELLLWMENHLPPAFFERFNQNELLIIARSLLGFECQGHFIEIAFKDKKVFLTLDSPESDLEIFEKTASSSLHAYQTFRANAPMGHLKTKEHFPLKIALARLCDPKGGCQKISPPYDELLIKEMGLSKERTLRAIELIERAKDEDLAQIDLRKLEGKEDPHLPSFQLLGVIKNPPKEHFLTRLAHILIRHKLKVVRASLSHLAGHDGEELLLFSLGLSPIERQFDHNLLVSELAMIKSFSTEGFIGHFIEKEGLNFKEACKLFGLCTLSHQMLLYIDPNLYSKEHVEEAFIAYPHFSKKLLALFEARLKGQECDLEPFLKEAIRMDTGNTLLDPRRRAIFQMGAHLIGHTLKCNALLETFEAIGFRLDPRILEKLPKEASARFEKLPFGIFFIANSHFVSYNIRFRDLSRGGLRTVLPRNQDMWLSELASVFFEAYQLAFTQQKKNKDIPEGGAKSVILTHPTALLPRELYLPSCQRSFIRTLVSLTQCDSKGKLLEKGIFDHYQKPEYLYLGPDENMSNAMIEWIAAYSVKVGNNVGSAFISSKPKAGINHKEYGVTSLGVHVYADKMLRSLGINPDKEPFTVKMTGGPDGDVAGNEMKNLATYCKKTAKLLAVTDGSGTIYEPKGLNLESLLELFKKGEPIANYPKELLSEGSFLLDMRSQIEKEPGVFRKVLYIQEKGKLIEKHLSTDEAQKLFATNLHQVKCDLFIPGGGRPRTLNGQTLHTFLDQDGAPSSRIIVEGANLYLTPEARVSLEERGVLVVKDSSANKCGVITSSQEVVLSLLLSEKEFVEHKKEIMEEILLDLRHKASMEADLLIRAHKESRLPMTVISDKISEKIERFADELMSAFENKALPKEALPLLKSYFIPFIQKRYPIEEICKKIPEVHLKAIFSSMIASRAVYKRGIFWQPSLSDILPEIFRESDQYLESY